MLPIYLEKKAIVDYLNFLADKDNGLDLQYEVKPCWNCSILMTPTMAQTIFVVLIIAAILWMGLAILLSIGQNQLMQNANDPDLHIKTDT